MCIASIEMYLSIQNINYFKMWKQATTATTKLQSMILGMVLYGLLKPHVKLYDPSNHSLNLLNRVAGGPFSFLNHTPVDNVPISVK